MYIYNPVKRNLLWQSYFLSIASMMFLDISSVSLASAEANGFIEDQTVQQPQCALSEHLHQPTFLWVSCPTLIYIHTPCRKSTSVLPSFHLPEQVQEKFLKQYLFPDAPSSINPPQHKNQRGINLFCSSLSTRVKKLVQSLTSRLLLTPCQRWP